jgi:3-hydroxybutyryl-CoA dehydrogenase
MTLKAIKSIAVIGAGTMGQGIAQVCGSAGFRVLLYDVQPDLLKSAIILIKKNLDTAVAKGKMTSEHRDETAALITLVSDFMELHADVVIEAAVEKLEVKQKIFADLEQINAKDCILTTNTSSISVTRIAAGLKYPDRFAGLHFFNPAPLMKLVEIVKGTGTSAGTISFLSRFTEKLGKEVVLAQDSPGFIVNRVARHYYVESLKVLEESVADHATIDALMKSIGFKMGPFELMDLIGVDVNFSVTTSMFSAFHHDAKFRPSRIQQQKVDAGHHGRKSGKGFYDYPKD